MSLSFILYILLCICAPQTPNLPLACFPFGNRPFCLRVCFCFMNGSLESYFRFHVEVMAYDICLSISDWLQLVRSSLGPPILPQMAWFHPFSWLSNISSCMYPILKRVKPPSPKEWTYWKKLSVVCVMFPLTKLMFSVLMEDSCLWKRMNKGNNEHWHAFLSKDYFITAFQKDICANGNFESNALVMGFHFG